MPDNKLRMLGRSLLGSVRERGSQAVARWARGTVYQDKWFAIVVLTCVDKNASSMHGRDEGKVTVPFSTILWKWSRSLCPWVAVDRKTTDKPGLAYQAHGIFVAVGTLPTQTRFCNLAGTVIAGIAHIAQVLSRLG